jgi:hypothetical protein
MAAAVRLQYHRLAAPFELVAVATEDLKLVGMSEEGWARIRRDWSETLRTTYEIDPETGLIQRVRGELGTDPDTMEFVTEAHELRLVEGILFPVRMTTFVGGEVAAETILDRVKIVSEFPDGTFVPSGSGADM